MKCKYVKLCKLINSNVPVVVALVMGVVPVLGVVLTVVPLVLKSVVVVMLKWVLINEGTYKSSYFF